MNNRRFITVEKIGKLTLSYDLYRNKWRMSGGRYGDHFIYAQYDGKHQCFDPDNERVQKHWQGYILNQTK